MKKYILLLGLLFFVVACQPNVSEQDAQLIAANFVKDRVRFTAYQNSGDKTIVNEAHNIIQSTVDEGDNWNVKIHVQAEVEGKPKSATFSVKVDKETGEVKDLQQMQNLITT
jgi:photosystem II stability/assembly factor-like uncharacterized protein